VGDERRRKGCCCWSVELVTAGTAGRQLRVACDTGSCIDTVDRIGAASGACVGSERRRRLRREASQLRLGEEVLRSASPAAQRTSERERDRADKVGTA
jgi:hypothetical protein